MSQGWAVATHSHQATSEESPASVPLLHHEIKLLRGAFEFS